MNRSQVLGDKFAIALSVLCLLHCLITPLVIIMPAIGGVIALDHGQFHEFMLFFVVPVGLVALGLGYRHHRSLVVLAGGLTGLSLLALAVLLGHDSLGGNGELILSVSGSLMIVLAHIQNFRHSRRLTV
ncbi:MerC domain-containing protein [Alteromonas lipolytica]|uniref:MerC mercury resistance protein n=1 Tax=Alteromonas lipolytica TaxID=1856405 RepID=A0A1E8FBZ5_9ALTE|nr:MerC domain-containing protein [Alteromonas lipolytica]OFI33457.1 hypothetical protein BFC17_04140 [Alteromonas lipolytica]GGF59516.1 hypothetical protein GCM10011338_09720 [Alteromonas lipolytica]